MHDVYVTITRVDTEQKACFPVPVGTDDDASLLLAGIADALDQAAPDLFTVSCEGPEQAALED